MWRHKWKVRADVEVVLLGARSQLGHDVMRTWTRDTVTALGHAECDVTDVAAVRAALTTHRPNLVVNLAAAVRVDDIERDPAEALRTNAYGAWIVARGAADVGAAIMWVSTDYVFSGDARQPYREDDRVWPVNAYGASKAAGERLVALATPHHYIVRSSGLYGVAGSSGKGGNFVETMLRLARQGQPLRVVHDQVLAPTSTYDLARAMAALARSGKFGLYHAANQGEISWHDFAARIFSLSGIAADLTPVISAEYPTPARRPRYSVLDSSRLGGAGVAPLPSIENALQRYLREKSNL